MVAAWVLLNKLPDDTQPGAERIKFDAAQQILSQPLYRDAYLSIFLLFFVFASILNFIPFRLKSLDPTISESALSLVYLGYLSGSLIAFHGARIGHLLAMANAHLRDAALGNTLRKINK